MGVPLRIALLEEFSELSLFFICIAIHVLSGFLFIKSIALTKSPQHQCQPF